jgi:hypothetical protein
VIVKLKVAKKICVAGKKFRAGSEEVKPYPAPWYIIASLLLRCSWYIFRNICLIFLGLGACKNDAASSNNQLPATQCISSTNDEPALVSTGAGIVRTATDSFSSNWLPAPVDVQYSGSSN